MENSSVLNYLYIIRDYNTNSILLNIGYLSVPVSVGQLNNGKWPACFARTVCCESGLSEPEIGLEHSTRVRRFCDLANEVNLNGRWLLKC